MKVSKPRKILITGIGDTRNNGCWAMVVTAITMIRELSPVPVEITVLTRKTSRDSERLKNFDVEFVTRPWTKVTVPKLGFLWSWFCFFSLPMKALVYRFLRKKTSSNEFWRQCLETDLFIDLSGDSISSDYSPFSLSTIAIPLLIARILRKPYMFCAQSIGPFSRKLIHKLFVMLLRDAAAITSRERFTDRILSQLSINSLVTPTQDLAFCLPSASSGRIRQICEKEGINAGASWVGVSVSELISSYGFSDELSAEGKRNAYVRAMAKLTDYIVTAHDMHILFIPHVTIPGISDDRKISADVYNSMKQKDKAVLIRGEYLGDELKGLIGLCDVFIGSRMHACIAALSQCIPTINYVYNHKTLGIIGEILGQWDYLIDLRKIRGENLVKTSKNVFEKLLLNRLKIRKQLAKLLPNVRMLAKMNAQVAVSLLEVAGPLRAMRDPMFCVGCGACVAVCKAGALALRETSQGTLRPLLIDKCESCFHCLRVCPSLGINIARHESDIFGKTDFDPETGIVINSYKGYSSDLSLRVKCASGGLVTEIARYLLEGGEVDGVLVAADNRENPLSPKPLWATDVHTLIHSSGSKYLPVPMVEGFKKIPRGARHLAVVGLPCHLWAIRLLEKMQYLTGVDIVLRLGLFCGRCPTIHALEFIIGKMGCSRKEVRYVAFRENGWPGKVCVRADDRYCSYPLEDLWPFMGSAYFTPMHCYSCPDQFGHLSDISFGDAWLPECKDDNAGWSLCIVRSQKGMQIVENMFKLGRIHLEEVEVERLKKAFIGNIRKKYRQKKIKTMLTAGKCRIYTKDSEVVESSLKIKLGLYLEYMLCQAGKSRVFQEMFLDFPPNTFMRLCNRLVRIFLSG